MTSISSFEKDSIATTPDSFKDCIIACKISSQVHTNFEKRKIQQADSGDFVQKWRFCKTYVLYNYVAKILEKHVRSSLYLLLVFLKENSHSHGKFTERLFLLQFLYIKFFEQIFLRTPTCSWRKKICQRKLKLGDR